MKQLFCTVFLFLAVVSLATQPVLIFEDGFDASIVGCTRYPSTPSLGCDVAPNTVLPNGWTFDGWKNGILFDFMPVGPPTDNWLHGCRTGKGCFHGRNGCGTDTDTTTIVKDFDLELATPYSTSLWFTGWGSQDASMQTLTGVLTQVITHLGIVRITASCPSDSNSVLVDASATSGDNVNPQTAAWQWHEAKFTSCAVGQTRITISMRLCATIDDFLLIKEADQHLQVYDSFEKVPAGLNLDESRRFAVPAGTSFDGWTYALGPTSPSSRHGLFVHSSASLTYASNDEPYCRSGTWCFHLIAGCGSLPSDVPTLRKTFSLAPSTEFTATVWLTGWQPPASISTFVYPLSTGSLEVFCGSTSLGSKTDTTISGFTVQSNRWVSLDVQFTSCADGQVTIEISGSQCSTFDDLRIESANGQGFTEPPSQAGVPRGWQLMTHLDFDDGVLPREPTMRTSKIQPHVYTMWPRSQHLAPPIVAPEGSGVGGVGRSLSMNNPDPPAVYGHEGWTKYASVSAASSTPWLDWRCSFQFKVDSTRLAKYGGKCVHARIFQMRDSADKSRSFSPILAVTLLPQTDGNGLCEVTAFQADFVAQGYRSDIHAAPQLRSLDTSQWHEALIEFLPKTRTVRLSVDGVVWQSDDLPVGAWPPPTMIEFAGSEYFLRHAVPMKFDTAALPGASTGTEVARSSWTQARIAMSIDDFKVMSKLQPVVTSLRDMSRWCSMRNGGECA